MMNVIDFPNRIVIELTPLCNLSCSMCPRHYISENSGFITEELWRKLVDEIASVNPQAVVLPFWRGEPLLHPDFFKLMEYAFQQSIRIHISTNGLLVSGKYAEVLSRCEFVSFSIHTPLGLTRARQFQSLVNGMSPSPTVAISFVDGEKSTNRYLEEIVASPDLGGFKSVRLYEKHTVEGVFGKIGRTVHAKRTFCPKLENSFVVAFDGSVSRCNHIWLTEKRLDLNQLTIREAWHSDIMQEIREFYPDQHCRSCDQWIGRTIGTEWRNIEGVIQKEAVGPMELKREKHETKYSDCI